MKEERLRKIIKEAIEEVLEGLIHTYPLYSVGRMLIEKFGLTKGNIKLKKTVTGVLFIDLVFEKEILDKQMIIEIRKFMETCGYHLAQVSNSTRETSPKVIYRFEPRFQQDKLENNGNETIKMAKDNGGIIGKKDLLDMGETILRHITPIYHFDKILKIGLCPRADNRYLSYNGRVHFLLGSTSFKEIKKLARTLYKFIEPKFRGDYYSGKDGEYVLLDIDIKSLPDGIQFFIDPNAEKSIYTTSNIPPACIINKTIINVKKDES